MNDNTFGLSKDEVKKINEIFDKFDNVDRVMIYGSRAKGNHKPYSDIDLTLAGNDISKQQLYQILLMLDDLLLPYIFDLNIKNKISNSDLLEHIERIGQIFYRKRNAE